MGLKSDFKAMNRLQKGFFFLALGLAVSVWSVAGYRAIKKKVNISAKEKYFVAPETIKSTKNCASMDSLEEKLKKHNLDMNEQTNHAGDSEFLDSYVRRLDRFGYDFGIKVADNPMRARLLVMAYLKRNGEEPNKKYYSIGEAHEQRPKLDCTEASEIAAAALYDDGFRPLILHAYPPEKDMIKNKDLMPHSVFLYKYNGRFGFIDNMGIVGPYLDSVEELIGFMGYLHECEYDKYRIYDLSKDNPNWMRKSSRENIPFYKSID